MTVTKDDLALFNQFFADYQQRYIRFAVSYIREVTIAEDIVIDSMMYYWENRAKLPPDANIPAYVLTIVKNKCLNYLKHVQVQQDAFAEMTEQAQWELNTRISTLEACEPDELFNHEVQNIVGAVLSKLPKNTRKVFTLSRYENKSHKEIAAELNISTKGVEFHITKVNRLLRQAFKDYLLYFLYWFFLG